MKIYAVVITFIALILSFLLWHSSTTNSVESRVLGSEIKGLKEDADSLRAYALASKDSLVIAFHTIRNINEEKELARQETIIARRTHTVIKYVTYETNNERDSVARELYPVISRLPANYAVAEPVFDSLTFETTRGRACENLAGVQAKELETQGRELIATGTALKLSQNASGAFEQEADTLRQALSKTEEKAKIDFKGAKKQGFKWGAIITGGAFTLLDLLILLMLL